MIEVIDLAHVLIVEGADPSARYEMEQRFEPTGHEIRADRDPAYKRATWGRRPEDVAAQRAVITDISGRRVR